MNPASSKHFPIATLVFLSVGLLISGAAAAATQDDVRLQPGYADSRFGEVHYWSAGTGPALVLIHQSSQSAAEFGAMMPYLAGEYRVVAIDLPGHGRSATPSKALSIPELAEGALAVLDELGLDRAHVLGHHGGADVVVEMAMQQPARIAEIVLTGVGTHAPEVLEEWKNMPYTRDLPIDKDGEFLGRTWEVYRKMSAPDTAPETTYLPFLVSLQARLRPHDMHHASYAYDFKASLEKLDRHFLILNFEHDLFGGDSDGLHERFPNSSRATVKGAGAWAFYEQPQACAAAVDAYLSARRN